jgi:glycosyltransferase involved in cell wall biosynthesis
MRVSIIIPVYNSHATIQRCVDGLERLEHPSFEVVFVDSSPDDRSTEIIRHHPRFKLIRSKERLLMHAARNLGVQEASGDVIVFTDPDCVVAPDWLVKLEEGLQKGYSVVGGGIALYPGHAADTAAHIIKFWRWLPGGGDRSVEDLATANFALQRKALQSVGGFRGDIIAGDTELSHRLRANGYELFFHGRAVVNHIHEATLMGLIRERFTRGVDFGKMRTTLPSWNTWKSALAVVGAPMLALRQVYWQFLASRKNNLLMGFFRAGPIIVFADIAWMLGASLGYIAAFRHGRNPGSTAPQRRDPQEI